MDHRHRRTANVFRLDDRSGAVLPGEYHARLVAAAPDLLRLVERSLEKEDMVDVDRARPLLARLRAAREEHEHGPPPAAAAEAGPPGGTASPPPRGGEGGTHRSTAPPITPARSVGSSKKRSPPRRKKSPGPSDG